MEKDDKAKGKKSERAVGNEDVDSQNGKKRKSRRQKIKTDPLVTIKEELDGEEFDSQPDHKTKSTNKLLKGNKSIKSAKTNIQSGRTHLSDSNKRT